jgi:predicted alpha/beta hydrolase family esterase
MAASRPILIVPGIGDSPEGHWQDLWIRTLPRAQKVEQQDWEAPRISDWLRNLEDALQANPGALVVAHSLGCSLVAHAAVRGYAGLIRGALLVAPPDLELRTPIREQLAAFSPVPATRLPFSAIVATSSDDPYVSPRRARLFAERWGAERVDLGHAGHVNIASGHGPWPEGLRLLRRLSEMSRAQAAA